MKRLLFVTCLTFFISIAFSNDFLSEQKNFPRVRNAYLEKETIISSQLKGQHLSLDNLNILITAYKAEKALDIFVKSKTDKKYHKLSTYPICSTSGNLGPKNKSGDRQTPEGFYSIDRFNPSSSYYLSLGINYPNAADKLRIKATNLGGDIFIHGQCVTIGCLPMTNDGINEIYLFAINARQNGQQAIPVYIFPFRFTEGNTKAYYHFYRNHPNLLKFWDNLKPGYDLFHKNMQPLVIKTDHNGNYLIQP